MELRQLRYFVEIAEELHYRRAASRLFISQPALSQQIRLLEKELGVDLFVRSRRSVQRKVELTEAGKVLLREARQILRLSTQAIEATRQAGMEAPVRIGVFKTLLRSRILNVMNLLTERLPQAKVRLVELPSFLSVQQALVENSVDLGLTILPLQYPELAAMPFASGNMAVLLPVSHHLVECLNVNLEQLRSEAWIEIPPPLNPVYEAVEALCRKSGFERNLVQEVSSLELLADLVRADRGVGLIPTHFAATDGMIAKPLADGNGNPYPELELQHVVAYRAGSTSPAVTALAG